MIVLSTDRLRVEISEPGECPNNGFRFDRAGFISEVVLDGAIHFCASEPKNLVHPSSGGRGLCSELQCDLSQEQGIGAYYPKFGVGLIPADGSPYVFHKKYDGVQYFPIRYDRGDNYVDFETAPLPCGGYSLREKKHVQVSDKELTVTYTVKNEGEKTIELEEYCHNFLSVDGMAISPQYHLSFPALKDFQQEPFPSRGGKPGNLMGDGKGVTFARADVGVSQAVIPLEEMEEGDGTFTWCLSHTGAKAYVEVKEEFLPDFVKVWTVDHIVSPEVFHRVRIEPGEQKSWKRSWRFDVM